MAIPVVTARRSNRKCKRLTLSPSSNLYTAHSSLCIIRTVVSKAEFASVLASFSAGFSPPAWYKRLNESIVGIFTMTDFGGSSSSKISFMRALDHMDILLITSQPRMLEP